ncbi:MAG TPA: hypothetical protein VGG79_22180 [Roseiarcus sp.]
MDKIGRSPPLAVKPLSAATITSTLKHLRNFFLWLSREPGFRSALNPNDANYFTPSEQDVRIGTSRREKRVATLEEIKRVLAFMPTDTAIEWRDQALVAFAILTGARDGAPASFRLKHRARTLLQDAREVRTKGRKTFTSMFFPVGPEPVQIVGDYVAMLKQDLSFSDGDPLFPSTQIGQGEIVSSSHRDCLESCGAELGRFDGFSPTLSHASGFPTPNRTAFVTRSLAWVSAYVAPLRNGRFGPRIWDMKARQRRLLDMGPVENIW